MARFQLEAEILRSIKSVRVPTFIEAFSMGEKHIIVQELIEGSPLSNFIANAYRFDERKVKIIIAQLLIILQDLHNPEHMENAIVHRDLRLSNLLIKNGDVYLIDFGFARYLNPKSGIVLPDPEVSYDREETKQPVEPAIRRNPGVYTYRLLRREISPRSDLFGVGVVAIDLFTNWVEDEALFTQPWEKVLPISSQFIGFLQRLLSRDNHGFSSVSEALNELKNI